MKEEMIRGKMVAAQPAMAGEVDVLPVDAERARVEEIVTEIVALLNYEGKLGKRHGNWTELGRFTALF